jgi:hypothetical protein
LGFADNSHGIIIKNKMNNQKQKQTERKFNKLLKSCVKYALCKKELYFTKDETKLLQEYALK